MAIYVYCGKCFSSSSIGSDKCGKCGTPFGRNRRYRVSISRKGKRTTEIFDNLARARQGETDLANGLQAPDLPKQFFFADVWMKYLNQTKADGKSSCGREQSLYTNWIEPVIGDIPLAQIAPGHLEKIKEDMGKSGAAPRSIHYALSVIRQVFNYAIRLELFSGSNPVSKVKKPTTDNRRMRFLTQAEAENLLKELEPTPTSRRITLLSLHCGLRFGEIASLTWSDVDLRRETLCVRNYSRSDMNGPKKSRTRFAYMTAAVKAEFSEMKPSGKSDLIFPDRNGNRRRQMSGAFGRAVKRLGLNDGIIDPRQRVCFHTCRHTFASWHAENGTSLFTLKEMLGHKTLEMTERYSHLAPETLQRATRELDRRLQIRRIPR